MKWCRFDRNGFLRGDDFSQFHPRYASFSGSFVEMGLMSDTADFFRSRPDQMIDLRYPLAVLPSRMPWQELEASVSHLFSKKVRPGATSMFPLTKYSMEVIFPM